MSRRLFPFLCFVVVLGAVAPAADAACTGRKPVRPFQRFGDPARYVLAPDGGFERRARGWALAGGARVVAGNEPYHVHGKRDRRSLRLPAGATATSPNICIEPSDPTLRVFARSTGGPGVRVDVEALVDVPMLGQTWVQIGVITASRRFRPTPVILVGVQAVAVLTGSTNIRLRFTAAEGNWQLDDLYVDPYKRR